MCIRDRNYVGQFGIEDASLQKIYAILFQKKISKGQRLTNWEADVLTDSQKKYAALDAWAVSYTHLVFLLVKIAMIKNEPNKSKIVPGIPILVINISEM